ncbi:lysostaphin resistance A-like protein [Poriferisphaera sp. WC338]|uniref:CPBP family intramembrane glutamic endopeptidase n=1 Tax=Poriferisphaera sp. WC338 TaxID=3425129 RepID=UPI003D817C52
MNQKGQASKSEVKSLTTYWERTHWPFQGLLFLLPLIVLYELGALLYVRENGNTLPTLKAELLLSKFFNLFGVTGYYLPGLILVVVLFCWHLVRRDPWKPEFRLYVIMWVESLVWTLPLLVFAAIVMREQQGGSEAVAVLQAAEAAGNGASGGIPDLQAGLLLSVGAGIYEELLFRLIGIALLHTLLVDVLALPPYVGAMGAVLGSSLAFAWVHPDAQALGMFAFYTVAGIYFAAVYLARGFGIVVATHALYDVIAVSSPLVYNMLSPSQS